MKEPFRKLADTGDCVLSYKPFGLVRIAVRGPSSNRAEKVRSKNGGNISKKSDSFYRHNALKIPAKTPQTR